MDDERRCAPRVRWPGGRGGRGGDRQTAHRLSGVLAVPHRGRGGGSDRGGVLAGHAGELISRSSLLYGPFSLVWGLAAVLLTLVFHRMDDQSAGKIFAVGTVLGGVYEYICSWVQEALFGACFWDYRHLPLNLNGRINLVFCLFWGAAALVWVRSVYPALCAAIDRVPRRTGRRIVRAAALFLVCSTALSAAALCRMDQRRREVPASGTVTRFLDEVYPDSRLKDRYPNMGILDEIGW